MVSQENNNPPGSLADSTLSQADSALSKAGISQASLAEGTLSQAESALSQAANPQATQAVRCSVRLRVLHASQADNAMSQSDSRSNTSPNINSQSDSNSQAGICQLAGNAVSQADNEASQVGSSQASVSQVTSSTSPQETRVSPFPNRQNNGSSSMEEPNPKWVINLSSKPLTKAQRSVLAKGPNFAVSPKHPPNLEYITAIESVCTKLSQQDAEELRADINQVLRASLPPKPNFTKA